MNLSRCGQKSSDRVLSLICVLAVVHVHIVEKFDFWFNFLIAVVLQYVVVQCIFTVFSCFC